MAISKAERKDWARAPFKGYVSLHSDESFVVGAAAYARGVRAKDVPYKATYLE